jgi:3-hydroxyacyl-[acyl-carrier-protein] dehydratase
LISISAADLLRRLPHRHPLALLDRVEIDEPGLRGTGVKNISISDPVFAGHFPGRPIYPGVLLIEAAGQAAGVVATYDPDARPDAAPPAGEEIAYLANVRKFAFRRLVVPGDQLRIEVTRGASCGQLVSFSVLLRVDGAVVASGSLAIAFVGTLPAVPVTAPTSAPASSRSSSPARQPLEAGAGAAR